jgi:hypothetical protein
VKNNFAAYEYRRLGSSMSILMQLIQSDGMGDWRQINEAGPKYQAVTAADLRRVSNKYFTRENRTVAIYTRKADAADAMPELTSLPAEQKKAAQAMMARLKTETDAAKLKDFLGKLEERIGSAEAEGKTLLLLQKKLIEQRIKELK